MTHGSDPTFGSDSESYTKNIKFIFDHFDLGNLLTRRDPE